VYDREGASDYTGFEVDTCVLTDYD
jgi:hypothetical protein